ncbi:biotin transporter BioY [Mesorhizobium sp. ASY16-5R]|uniref:biotin transporter BioY n=1 Tax=Mesorhizobium sp. ASY16-5R TaxID=3445772 RepID=UPI003FA002A4
MVIAGSPLMAAAAKMTIPFYPVPLSMHTSATCPTGLLWLDSVTGFDKPVLKLGLYPFVPGDLVKSVLAAMLFPMLWCVAR